MVTEQRLREYRAGLQAQLESLQAQVRQVEGALMFCDQVLMEMENDEKPTSTDKDSRLESAV
jgi:prefoldin subunit 5